MTLINEQNYIKSMTEEVEAFLSEKGKVTAFTSFDGNQISYEEYNNPQEKGAVIVLHGFTESAEKMREVSYYFYNEGYSVYALDLRDHGNSFRTSDVAGRVDTDDFGKYEKDLECLVDKVIKAENSEREIYIFSHSLGSTVALLYMLKNPVSVKRAVLSSPMICGNMGMPVAVAGTVAKMLTALGGKKIPAPGRCVFNPDLPFEKSDATSKVRFEYYQKKRKENKMLQTNGPSFGWVKASLDARDKILSSADKIKTELLVIKPEEDKQLLMSYTDKFIEKSGAESIVINGSKHEIFMSGNSALERYYENIFEFLR